MVPADSEEGEGEVNEVEAGGLAGDGEGNHREVLMWGFHGAIAVLRRRHGKGDEDHADSQETRKSSSLDSLTNDSA